MAMGTRKRRERQAALWVSYTDMAVGPGHPFYVRLNEVLDGSGFDALVEKQCARFYADKQSRPGLAPGIFFRSRMIGYFEGIEAERGTAWRLKDALNLRRFCSGRGAGIWQNQAGRKRRHIFILSHGHTAVMSKTEQIDATAHGILNTSAPAYALQTGAPVRFRSRILFLAQRSLQTREGMFKQRSLYDHGKKMRTPRLQVYGCAWKGPLQRNMCRCAEDTRTYLPMQAR
jgi:hypothetical protein